MDFKKQSKYKVGDEVKFFYYYEDKVGIITSIDGENKYLVQQNTNKIYYPTTGERIEGKLVQEKK